MLLSRLLCLKTVILLMQHVVELLNLSLQTLLFRGILRFLFLFTDLYILGVIKHTLFNKFLSQNRQPIWQEKRRSLWKKEGNYSLYVIFWTYIIHWIAIYHCIGLNLGYFSCNIVDIYQKRRKITGKKLLQISFLVMSICVYFGL